MIPTIALEHGGPTEIVRMMARSVSDLGARVDIATTNYGTSHDREDPDHIWVYDENNVTYRLFPYRSGSRWNVSLSLTRWLLENVSQYDLLHVHAPFAYPTLSACLAARRARVPYVYHAMGALDPWSLRQKSWKKWPYYQLFERRNLENASVVQVMSEPERQAVAALGIQWANIALIPYGAPEASRPRASISDSPFRVLFIGRLHPKKGLPLLIEATRRLHAEGVNVRLEVAGSGDEMYTASLVKQVRACGLDTIVHFAGFATGEEKARLLAESHIMALPSYDENFGVSVIEAMTYALPVVISDAVGLADHVRAAGAGRVCRTGDAVALADGLREFLSPAEREACGKRGAALASEEFTVAAVGRRLMSEYLRITEGRRTASLLENMSSSFVGAAPR